MNSQGSSENEKCESEKPLPFKKPLLIGKVGRLPRKVVNSENTYKKEEKPADAQNNEFTADSGDAIASNQAEVTASSPTQDKFVPLPYKEPAWSGLPQARDKDYIFEVLKSGTVIENINLMKKPYWVFGRLGTCDICMAHPTVSRHHAVLQYRSQASDDQPAGFYLYDLASTHGTFLNKNRLKSRVYVRVQVGHMIKFGCSSRTYLLTGPPEDAEEESELSITELKKRRAEELLKRAEAEREAQLKHKQEEEAKQKMLAEKGVDWGMGEDADEEADLAENPFAQTNNEDLYLDDPKKALRGFMEREGHDLEYDCSEQGMGQFLCKVELPVDDERGRPIVAEVLHKGKKKEAVVQCALEACRILDRYGLLRQATHESRKRKVKNWEENDFYDSDDDTFLDRTGVIEKKRESRMKAKIPQQPETYQSLIEKQKTVCNEINEIEKQLSNSNKTTKGAKSSPSEEDTLDSYMSELKQAKLDKQKISKLKTDLSRLKHEYANIVKLVNIARPVNLPPLVPQVQASSTINTLRHKLPLYGKRLKVKVQLPARPQKHVSDMDVDGDEEEEDEDDHATVMALERNDERKKEAERKKKDDTTHSKDGDNLVKHKYVATKLTKAINENSMINKPKMNLEEKYQLDCNKIEASLKKIFPLMSNEHETYISNVWIDLKTLNQNYLIDRKRGVLQILSSYFQNLDPTIKDGLSKEIEDITAAISNASSSDMIVEIGRQLITLVKEITHLVNKLERVNPASDTQGMHETEDKSSDVSEEEAERRRRKNQRRIQHRQERAEIEKQRGYKEDASKEDYNMWVPPAGQTGDGRTRLNDALGY